MKGIFKAFSSPPTLYLHCLLAVLNFSCLGLVLLVHRPIPPFLNCFNCLGSCFIYNCSAVVLFTTASAVVCFQLPRQLFISPLFSLLLNCFNYPGSFYFQLLRQLFSFNCLVLFNKCLLKALLKRFLESNVTPSSFLNCFNCLGSFLYSTASALFLPNPLLKCFNCFGSCFPSTASAVV